MTDHWLPLVLCLICYATKLTSAYMGAKMGVITNVCDDAKTNLTLDWDGNFASYTCMQIRKWQGMSNVPSFYFEIPNFNPKLDQVIHFCMNSTLTYADRPPLRGNHRPLWAKWGEYLYLPTQRWLHNLEHGAIVMLYHPCADEREVHKLRGLVTSCLYRHIITPYDALSSDRPIALVSWGAKLEMNVVEAEQVIKFIKKHAHRAPEDLSKQGQYEEMLVKPSNVLYDIDDTIVCPWAPDVFYTQQYPQAQFNQNQIGYSFWQKTNHASAYRLRRAANANSQPTFVEPLLSLEMFNGPKQAADVLPPMAQLQTFNEQPNYVAAGTFLGANPMQPNTLFRHTDIRPYSSLNFQPQYKPNVAAADVSRLSRLLLLASLIQRQNAFGSNQTLLPGLLPSGALASLGKTNTNSVKDDSTTALLNGILSLLIGAQQLKPTANGRPLALPLTSSILGRTT